MTSKKVSLFSHSFLQSFIQQPKHFGTLSSSSSAILLPNTLKNSHQKSIINRWNYSESNSRTITTSKLENVLILGAGLMGSGIAQCVAASGKFRSITLQDVSPAQLDKAQQSIAKSYGRIIKKRQSWYHYLFVHFI